MLVGLRLENIALLDSLELTFDSGFTVLTGETGAGKSILLDAIDALFAGNQVSTPSRLLRDKSKTGHIEASFLLNPEIEAWFESEGYEFENNEFLLTRELRFIENRLINRCRLNGVLINRHQLATLRPFLIDLTVQGQTEELTSSERQLFLLDRFGTYNLKDALQNVESAWINWQEDNTNLLNALKELDQLKLQAIEHEKLLFELEAAEIEDPDEDHDLEIEQDRLVNGVKLQEGFHKIFLLLKDETNNMPSAIEQFGQVLQELKALSKLDSSLMGLLDQVLEININMQELILQLENYYTLLDSDPSQLNKLQARLSMLKRLQLTYGLDLSGLIQRRDQLRKDLCANDIEKLVIELKDKEKKSRMIRDKNNSILSVIRRELADTFEKKLMNYLKLLGLSNSRFQIHFDISNPSSTGIDSIQFLFSANPGESLAPLSEVASGGEMSRFLLAFKTVLSYANSSSTLFFDEIDAGVSGRISGSIASVLKDLSINRQVFCVTHQPIVAAIADHHFRVSKEVKNGVTRSNVSQLSQLQDREKELADLAGGDFQEARIYAASLLDQQAA